MRQGWQGVGARGTITSGAGSVFRAHVFGVDCCIALHLNEDIGYQTQRSGEFYASRTYFSRAPLAIRATRARCRARCTEVRPPLAVLRTRSQKTVSTLQTHSSSDLGTRVYVNHQRQPRTALSHKNIRKPRTESPTKAPNHKGPGVGLWCSGGLQKTQKAANGANGADGADGAGGADRRRPAPTGADSHRRRITIRKHPAHAHCG